MKIETKEDALLHCFDLWLWLALNPASYKDDWPGWELNGGYLKSCRSLCPVCEYGLSGVRQYCNEKCLIKWTGERCVEGEFSEWSVAETPKARTKWALKIATLALNEL